MADERYEWLDEDAAEQLLRGEPVEPVDDRARSDALRLTAALEAARTLPPARGGHPGELPGESVALAAFREAAHTRRRSGAGTRRATPKAQGAKAGQRSAAWQDRVSSVLISGGGRPATDRRQRWSRPVRYGLVLSLAGCALGGVAAASGAGFLPVPFGGQGSPLPAASVSAAASPDELASELPSDGDPSPTPRGEEPGPRTADPSESPMPGSGHSSPGSDDGPAEGSGHGDDGSGSTRRPTDGTDRDDASHGSGGTSAGEAYEKARQACREYRAGTLDRDARRRLVEMAKSEENLDRFCARLVDEDDRNGGSEDGGSDSGVPEGAPGSDGGGEGGGEQGEGAGQGDGGAGSLPSVSFRTAGPSPEISPEASPGTGTGVSTGVSGGSAPVDSATAVPWSR